ncbi:MAG: T9SS type A sorting domain-containing protein [Ignavibacteria bacterium]|nr:T9SS type A sorting domain-containing protein [Ignavibacteria bacterium]
MRFKTILRFVYISVLISLTSTFAQNHFNQNSKGLQLIEQDFRNGVISFEQALLQKFYFGFDKNKLDKKYFIENDLPGKCATDIIRDFYLNESKLSNSTIQIIKSYLDRPFSRQQELSVFISPYGKFELTYSTTGPNAVPSADNNSNGVPDFVEWIADYFDYSWKFSIDTLGYLAPPIGSGRYQIGFENMDYYGYTEPIGPKLTRIVMHNNFLTFPPNTDPEGNQQGAAKVTAIHEFKHAIQIVYNNWTEPSWFIEMDATWMEDIGYNQVNDYYNYLGSSHIVTPGRAFSEGSGYEDCIFMHYITQKHNVSTNKQIWDRRISFPYEEIFNTLNNILLTKSSNLTNALKEYFVWNYLCGIRATNLLAGYKEARWYPSSTLCREKNVFPDSSSGCELSHTSANYLQYKFPQTNQFLRIEYWGSSGGTQSIQLVLIYKNNTAEIRTINLPQSNQLNYLLIKKFHEIASIGILPIVTSTSPGKFPYNFKVSAFQTAAFTHTPLRDIETPLAREVKVKVVTESNMAIMDSLKLNYSSNGINYTSLKMIATGSPNEFSAMIPSFGVGTEVSYYISIYDTLGNYLYCPELAPAQPFKYFIGPDTKPPVIIHTPKNSLTRYSFPHWIFTSVTDNIGVDSVQLEFRLNNLSSNLVRMKHFRDDVYYYELISDSSELNEGDVIYYRITAVDNSSNKNKSYFPADNYAQLKIKNGKYFSSSPNRIIRDSYIFGIKDTIEIPYDVLVNELNIRIQAVHNRFSDLEMRLIPPTSLVYLMFSRPGLNSKYSNAKNPNIILDQDAYLSFANFELVDSTLAVGTFKPDTLNLNDFKGINAKGKWTLLVYDRQAGETGTLIHWGLIIRQDSITTAVKESEFPNRFLLTQNYPNPFNSTTNITYQLPAGEFVTLKIYDILGREIDKLVNEYKQAGTYNLRLNASDLPSGIYFYELKAGSFSQSKKFVLLR